MDKFHVLIVDDNPFNRKLLSEILKSHNYSLDEAKNGNEAIDRILEKSYQVIIMDMLMPGIDGFETTKKIREIGITTPVIAHTSMSMKQDQRRCKEAGCNDFLPKPINIDNLLKLLKKYSLAEQNQIKQPDFAVTSVPGQEPFSFSGLNLLLVEEDSSCAENYLQVLKNLGFKVTYVPNGVEAWKTLQKNKFKFNMIVSNIFTSGIDGLGLLIMSKRKYPDILVFIYAMDYNIDTFQLTIRLGADGIIPQSEFKNSIAGIIRIGIDQAAQKGSRLRDASTAMQVRKSQKKLIQFDCNKTCGLVDISYSTLHDAGGDMARCRPFNKAGRCGIVLGDVSGHDIMSSYISAVFMGILSSVWDSNKEPMKLLKVINTELLKIKVVNYHVCVSALLWDMRRCKLKIATAGNPGAILCQPTDSGFKLIELKGGGMCLGLLDMDDLYISQEIDFKPGSLLFLFSDGIDYEKMSEVLLKNKILLKDSASGLSGKILDKVIDKWSQEDDIIIVSIKAPEPGPLNGIHSYFKSTYEGVDKAYAWIIRQIEKFGCPKGKDKDTLVFAIREALLNAVEHGNKSEDSYVDISLYFSPEKVIAEISDEGSGFNLNEKLAEIKKNNGLQMGKRGLSIINSFSDNIKVNGGTVALSFYKK
ncbi:serine/threonine-protein kinase RsbW [Candidatus Magnetomoraceae bacterium gMMP-1]